MDHGAKETDQIARDFVQGEIGVARSSGARCSVRRCAFTAVVDVVIARQGVRQIKVMALHMMENLAVQANARMNIPSRRARAYALMATTTECCAMLHWSGTNFRFRALLARRCLSKERRPA